MIKRLQILYFLVLSMILMLMLAPVALLWPDAAARLFRNYIWRLALSCGKQIILRKKRNVVLDRHYAN
jgi:hypothetical protein